jgi:hypothetical protein
MDMLVWQQGQLEYAVAALAIWMCTSAGMYVADRLPIWKIPLECWPGAVKDFGNECRRLGQIFGGGQAEVKHAFAMRKLVALCGRSLEQADWETEHKERCAVGTAKFAFQAGVVSTLAYKNMRAYELKNIVDAAMPALVKRSGDLDEYVEKRWWTTPRGTSSFGAQAKRALQDLNNPMLDLQMRPIKPTVQESLDHHTIKAWLRTKPRAVARGSTKPEPGMKRRALLAVDDITAYIAGYASQHVEITTKYAGMVLRQDPADVSEWVNFDIGEDVWRVSNDYSNFNILNSLRSMQLIDLEFAKAWDRVKLAFAQQKKLAHLWVAASYLDMTMVTPYGTATVMNGLWSGHRNTARDNTMLHVVYLSCIKSIQRALFGEAATTIKQRICGDDETLSYYNWAAAVCHTLVADAAGYKSQVTKGLLSRGRDEFLQLMRNPGNIPSYPVCATILTFCSGNWYKDAVRDITSTVKDVSDHAWDMYLGGVPFPIAQELAARACDYLMQIKGAQGTLLPLVWWPYRGCGLPGGHPLWGVGTAEAPELTVRVDVGQVPNCAVQDSIVREKAFWDDIPEGVRLRVIRERTAESYRPVAKVALTKEGDMAAAQCWPIRDRWTTDISEAIRQPLLPSVPKNRWRAIPTRALDRSPRTVAIKVGFPPELLNTEYMWNALIKLAPRDRATMLQGLHDKQKPTKGWRWWMPPLLRVS